jgi:glutamine cyclotransferase
VWRDEWIARISLNTGEIVGWIDLRDVSEPFSGDLNGIAYDESGGRLFITGKNWDTLYEIELGF